MFNGYTRKVINTKLQVCVTTILFLPGENFAKINFSCINDYGDRYLLHWRKFNSFYNVQR